LIGVEGAQTPPKMLTHSIVRGQVRGSFSKSCGLSAGPAESEAPGTEINRPIVMTNLNEKL